MRTDHELIDAWRKGDQHAATLIVERHSDLLCRMASKLGVRDEVEELVQDVFVRAFNAIDSYRGDRAAFGSWLVVIMRRLVLDRGRASQRNQKLVPLAAADLEKVSEFGALDVAIASETEDRLLASIDDLDDRRLVRMRLAGLRWRVIAISFGVPEVSVRVRYHRIRAALREVAA